MLNELPCRHRRRCCSFPLQEQQERRGRRHEPKDAG